MRFMILYMCFEREFCVDIEMDIKLFIFGCRKSVRHHFEGGRQNKHLQVMRLKLSLLLSYAVI